MKLKRLAIVGLGSIGRRHFRLIKNAYPEIEIIIVHHGTKCKEESMAHLCVSSIQEAIENNIQAAIISSPTSFHIEQAIELVNSGIHLLIEKPLSNSFDKINELSKLIEKNKTKVLTGYVLRFDTGAMQLKEWLLDKKIGDILHVRIECGSFLPDWRPGQNYLNSVSVSAKLGGGVLTELSHELDYLCWFFGRPIKLYAKLRNTGKLKVDVEDQVDLIVTSKEGYPITVQLDFNRRHPTRICEIQTEHGKLTWNAIDKTTSWEQKDKKTILRKFSFDRDYIYQEQIKNFVDCIENNQEPVCSFEDGVDALKLIIAAYHSNKINQEVII